MKPFKNALNRLSSFNAFYSVAAMALGLLLGFIILIISNPSQALPGFGMILTGGVTDAKSIGQVLYFATPIIMTGLSVGFAGKTGLFNIGASGQFILGAYAAVAVGVHCVFLQGPFLWIAALMASVMAGAVWGALPGLLRAYCNVNEVISGIMTNYIAMYLTNFLVTLTVFNPLKNQSVRVADNANLPKIGMDAVFPGSSVNSGILIAIIMAVIIYVVLNKTVFGYELKACGLNRDSSKYAGINERKSIALSMVFAGAMAGLGGALLYLAGSGKGIDVLEVLAPEGFNGIPVALLGLNNPIGIIFSGLFVSYLTVGGFNIQLYDFAPQIIEIIISVVIYFSAFTLLLKGFIEAKKSSKKEDTQP